MKKVKFVKANYRPLDSGEELAGSVYVQVGAKIVRIYAYDDESSNFVRAVRIIGKRAKDWEIQTRVPWVWWRERELYDPEWRLEIEPQICKALNISVSQWRGIMRRALATINAWCDIATWEEMEKEAEAGKS